MGRRMIRGPPKSLSFEARQNASTLTGSCVYGKGSCWDYRQGFEMVGGIKIPLGCSKEHLTVSVVAAAQGNIWRPLNTHIILILNH